MKSFTLKTLAVIACLTFSQTALARQVAVCYLGDNSIYPTDSIACYIGNADTKNKKETTLFEMTKAGWSIQAVTPVQWKREGDYFSYETRIYLEKP